MKGKNKSIGQFNHLCIVIKIMESLRKCTIINMRNLKKNYKSQ